MVKEVSLKFLLLSFLCLCLFSIVSSCKQPKAKEIKVVELKEEVAKNVVETIKEEPKFAVYFKEVLASIPAKNLPVIKATNFDSFIDAKDYKKVDEVALSLHKVYPAFEKKGNNYRAIANYKLKLSDKFNTVVVTVLKGEHEMESMLINYDLKGNIITHQIVAYDEIAEGMSQVNSIIEKNKITVNDILFVEEKQETTTLFETLDNGKIKEIKSSDILIDEVIQQLNLPVSKVKRDLIAVKVKLNNPNESIVVIPEIALEDEHYYEYNSHILIVDNVTKNIKQKYFESYKTNGWVSDAIELKKISIDTAPYKITDTLRAFGVRLQYVGMSRVNPYVKEYISLFFKKGKNLRNVLHNFIIESINGRIDDDCVGEIVNKKKTLIITDKNTNRFNNIMVKNKITSTVDFKDKNGDCDYKETIAKEIYILKFDGEMYK